MEVENRRKLYIISGLGSGANVFDRIDFGSKVEPVFLPYLIPEKDESFQSYTARVGKPIDKNEEFYLMGFSFGGLIAQEINKYHRAKKVIILGSIKSDTEKSIFFRFCKKTKLHKLVPMSFFYNEKFLSYTFFRKLYSKKLPKLYEYFTLRDPYYLRWSIDHIINWKGDFQDNVIQILAEKDAVFPPKYSHPDYCIKDASHFFPITKPTELSNILKKIF